MARLIQKSPRSKNNVFFLNKDRISLGRAQDNDIVLDQGTVSRYHAEIGLSNGVFTVRDLSSTNGTYINGIITKEAVLTKDDVIRIGGYHLVFDESTTEALSICADTPLAVLQQVGKAVNSIMDEKGLMETMMGMLFSIFRVDRGLFLLIDKASGEFVTSMSRGYGKDEKVVVSRTLLEQVAKQKLGLIVFDTMSDPRFAGSESIVSSDMGSIMAVPMLIKDEVIGVMQIGFSKGGRTFAEGDLDLACSISDYLAIGIEQARLNEKVKVEARVRANLERFHSPEVVNKIVSHLEEKGDVGLEVEEKEVSILFADICNFTSMSESLPPVEIMALLNEYFTHMTDIIFDYGGTLDKFIGDAVMALFGVPYKEKNHADRAVDAAIKMQEMTNIFSNTGQGRKDFRIKIGINSGKVVAGNVGSPKRMEYSVIGDAVNVASRLCGLCEPGQIMIGERTRELLTGEYAIDALGEKAVKGKKKGVLVHCLKCEEGGNA